MLSEMIGFKFIKSFKVLKHIKLKVCESVWSTYFEKDILGEKRAITVRQENIQQISLYLAAAKVSQFARIFRR